MPRRGTAQIIVGAMPQSARIAPRLIEPKGQDGGHSPNSKSTSTAGHSLRLTPGGKAEAAPSTLSAKQIKSP